MIHGISIEIINERSIEISRSSGSQCGVLHVPSCTGILEYGACVNRVPFTVIR